jgi:predicted nucleotidyltransferase
LPVQNPNRTSGWGFFLQFELTIKRWGIRIEPEMSQTFEAYLPEIRRRHAQERTDWDTRRAHAWEGAHRIAALLRNEFGASQVFAFGSMTRTGRFDERSDIDIGVTGIAPRDFYRAVARAMGLTSFELDLVDLSDCAPSLRQAIESEGIAI